MSDTPWPGMNVDEKANFGFKYKTRVPPLPAVSPSLLPHRETNGRYSKIISPRLDSTQHTGTAGGREAWGPGSRAVTSEAGWSGQAETITSSDRGTM